MPVRIIPQGCRDGKGVRGCSPTVSLYQRFLGCLWEMNRCLSMVFCGLFGVGGHPCPGGCAGRAGPVLVVAPLPENVWRSLRTGVELAWRCASAGAVALHVPVCCDIICAALVLSASHRQQATRQGISIMRALIALASRIGMRIEVVRVEIYRSCTGASTWPGYLRIESYLQLALAIMLWNLCYHLRAK
jgi:hypothetical protein